MSKRAAPSIRVGCVGRVGLALGSLWLREFARAEGLGPACRYDRARDRARAARGCSPARAAHRLWPASGRIRAGWRRRRRPGSRSADPSRGDFGPAPAGRSRRDTGWRSVMFLLSVRTIRTTCIRLTLSSDSHQGRGRSCRSETCRCGVEASGRPWFDSESVDGDFGPRPQSSRPAAIAASVQTLLQTAGVSRFRQKRDSD